MLVSRPIEAEEADGRQSSELKTLNGIGVGAEADGVYVCIAENNRTAGSRNISVAIRGLWSSFSNEVTDTVCIVLCLVPDSQVESLAYLRFFVSLDDIRVFLNLTQNSTAEFESAFLSTLVSSYQH